MKRREVCLLTDNERKVSEYRRLFDRYGIGVVRRPAGIAQSEPEVRALLEARPDPETRTIAVLREESRLVRHGGRDPAEMLDLERVDNLTTLRAWTLDRGAIVSRTYEHATEGWIDLSRRQPPASDVFGWDDVFVLKATGRTYHELRGRGFKVSSRDMTISAFLRDFVYYDSFIDLNWNPQRPERTIDFANSVAEFVEKNPHLRNPRVRECGLANAFDAVLDEGVFFRAAKNRREKNYWLPGLNAGIPFVPKRDPIHEITYMAHDFGHFLIPDLLFTGSETSPEARLTYVTYRMMSEAATLVLADMFFVDALARSGERYDWAKRRIYPLFLDTGLDLSKRDDLRRLLWANVRFVLHGDDGGYRELLDGRSTSNLELFREKYAPFFVEDFRWTDRNYAHMHSRRDEFRRWWDVVGPLRDRARLRLETIDEFASALGPGDRVERIFERIFATRIEPALAGRTPRPPAERLLRGFFRYMLGQLGVFFRFDFVPEATTYRDRIVGFLEKAADRGELDLGRIRAVRGFYEQFIDLLKEKNLISMDDAETWKEVYPLFEPYYVFYDEGFDAYEDLASVARRILIP